GKGSPPADPSAGYGGDGGPAVMAELNHPAGLAFDPNDNLYIADYANRAVRKVDAATGLISTVAGQALITKINGNFVDARDLALPVKDGRQAKSGYLASPLAVAADMNDL